MRLRNLLFSPGCINPRLPTMPMTGNGEFPSLVTDRLDLRGPRIDDAEPFFALLSIPEVTQFSNWPDAPRKAQIERFVRWMVKLFSSGKGCAWIVEDVVSEMIGDPMSGAAKR